VVYNHRHYEAEEAMGGTGNYSQSTGMENGKEVVIPLQREEVTAGKEQINNGAIRVRKVVRTETVNQPVQVRVESVTVDRVPAGSPADNNAQTALNAPFQGGEITIPLMREQPVMQKQIVPNGSVVIRTQETTQTANLQGEVRSEHVVAEPVGNPQNVNISGSLRGGAEESSGAPAAEYGQSTGAGGGQITQWNELSSSPQSCVGRQVNIQNVRVERVISPRLLEVQGDNGQMYFVHLDQPAKLQAGQTIVLTGKIQQVPSDTQTLGWGPESTQALQGQQIFIAAPSVNGEPQQ
jgi:uncharacterized protein (TIGR02271 family)